MCLLDGKQQVKASDEEYLWWKAIYEHILKLKFSSVLICHVWHTVTLMPVERLEGMVRKGHDMRGPMFGCTGGEA